MKVKISVQGHGPALFGGGGQTVTVSLSQAPGEFDPEDAQAILGAQTVSASSLIASIIDAPAPEPAPIVTFGSPDGEPSPEGAF